MGESFAWYARTYLKAAQTLGLLSNDGQLFSKLPLSPLDAIRHPVTDCLPPTARSVLFGPHRLLDQAIQHQYLQFVAAIGHMRVMKSWMNHKQVDG
jgi:hypothetical protein